MQQANFHSPFPPLLLPHLAGGVGKGEGGGGLEQTDRILRHLSALGHLHETGPGAYRPTAFTRSLAHPLLGDGYSALAPLLHGAQTFHEHSRARGHVDPTDPRDTALQSVAAAMSTGAGGSGGENLMFFPYLVRRGLDGWFNHHMGGYKLGCRVWMRDYFPVRERLFGGASEDVNGDGKGKANNDLFLVDLGGGLGHELAMFKKMFPDHPGRLVLHDLPPVIEKIVDLDASIERIPYDMTSDETPVKGESLLYFLPPKLSLHAHIHELTVAISRPGARAYFMHSIMHIWPDQICQKALANVKSAMVPGYSKLLINDHVVPASDAYWETSALDLLMMSFHAARERTEAEWYRLLEEVAGFRIVKIWDGGRGNESLIECEVPLERRVKL